MQNPNDYIQLMGPKNTKPNVGGHSVSIMNKGRNEVLTRGPPETKVVIVSAQTEPGFIAEDNPVPFHSSPVSP